MKKLLILIILVFVVVSGVSYMVASSLPPAGGAADLVVSAGGDLSAPDKPDRPRQTAGGPFRLEETFNRVAPVQEAPLKSDVLPM